MGARTPIAVGALVRERVITRFQDRDLSRDAGAVTQQQPRLAEIGDGQTIHR